MPFPTVDGKTIEEDLKTVKTTLKPLVTSKEFWSALDRIFNRLDIVSTQLYDDVQTLKQAASRVGWQIKSDDPSQESM